QLNADKEASLQTARDLRQTLCRQLAEDSNLPEEGWLLGLLTEEHRLAQKRIPQRLSIFKNLALTWPQTFDEQMHYLHTNREVPRSRWLTFFLKDGKEYVFGTPLDYEQIILGEEEGILRELMRFTSKKKWVLERIKKMPDSMTKLGLLEQYWHSYASLLLAGERESVITLWHGLIIFLAGKLERWRHIEDTSLRAYYFQRSTPQTPVPCQHSHFYHKNILGLARACLAFEAHRVFGCFLLKGLTCEEGLHRSLYYDRSAKERLQYLSDQTVYRAYASYQGRVAALLLLADEETDQARHYLDLADAVLATYSVIPQTERALLGGHDAYLRGLVAARWFALGETDKAIKGLDEAIQRIDQINNDLQSEDEPPVIPERATLLHPDLFELTTCPRIHGLQIPHMVERGYLAQRSPSAERAELLEIRKELLILAPLERMSETGHIPTQTEVSEIEGLL
ncbi:MAG TPA: hypothetical protein VJC18_06780, partial [bacterium]|nr:hypothetical protein [bacterium]